MFIGLALVILGVISLLVKMDIVTLSALGYIWPAVLVLLGLAIIWGRTAGRRYWGQTGCCCSTQEQSKTEQ